MKAVLRNYDQAVRKVRLVANLLRGKRADEALLMLEHTPRKASRALRKLLESALANAGASRGEAGSFRVVSVVVDKGLVYRRFIPRARGMAAPIRRERSHITLTLAPYPSEEKRAKKGASAQSPQTPPPTEDGVTEKSAQPSKKPSATRKRAAKKAKKLEKTEEVS